MYGNALCRIDTNIPTTKSMFFSPTDVGSNLSCIHTVTQMLLEILIAKNAVTYNMYNEARKMKFNSQCISSMIPSMRGILCVGIVYTRSEFTATDFVVGKFEIQMENVRWSQHTVGISDKKLPSNICCWKFRPCVRGISVHCGP
ncbi:hypothetical protein AB205_0200220, partial [Aquarana catesbeiana]